ncbi:hypothetical protein P9232_11790 [Weizmannia sp. CD-2023]|uniref:hypothetical protein n=1 Tax=Heyndrickxia TaxID=2837504 RepID=UPI002E20CCC3|nr:hypothetical protein [Weizmannia sp. CD-2023]MED4977356.1 hypothetical protein [Weizmannia sp. CD-2023]
MNKSGDFAIFNNKEYEFYLNDDNTCNLVTDDPNSVNDGFLKDNLSNRYVKKVNISNIQEAYTIVMIGKYNDIELNIHEEKDGYYLIGTSDAKTANQLNLERVDKYYYQGWISSKKLTVVQQKEIIKL